MTPERVGEMRRLAESLQTFMHGKPSRAMSECLDEIERLRKQLDEATTDCHAWESKARSLAAECGYANPDYLEP